MNPDIRITAATFGPVPRQNRPSMVMQSFRLPPATAEAFDARCLAEQVNKSDVLRELVEEWLENE